MFGKKAASPTVIGKGARVEGKLVVTGSIQVDGCVDGMLEAAGDVSIGPGGVVTGEVRGQTIALGGRVEGAVFARGHLHMLSTGHVEGDVHYGTLQVERGAVIDGRATQLVGDEQTAAHAAPGTPMLASEASEPVHAV